MVEFGLKLEDNKVSEWSDSYIDYEKLKSVLKKAKAAQARYDEHIKKRPEEAERIIDSFYTGMTSHAAISPSSSSIDFEGSRSRYSTPHQSAISLSKLDNHGTNRDAGDVPQQAQQPTETTKLLSGPAATPTNDRRKVLVTSPSLGESFGSASQYASEHATSSFGFSFSGYFENRYKRYLEDTLKDLEKCKFRFDQTLTQEIAKIQQFYQQKVHELERRLDLLLDNVQESIEVPLTASISTIPQSGSATSTSHSNDDNDDNGETPDADADVNSDGERDSDGNGDGDGDSPDAIHKLRPIKMIDKSSMSESEVESIQRALADQYRTAKLLQNFVIMNYTGLVKIVKKHDKVVPSNKGNYKHAVQAENLCNEGKEVELLSSSIEKCYAVWFCDGDQREAHAQMLPKRGDGLEMDWSQLRLGYRMGMCAVLGMWVCWDCIWGLVEDGNSTIGGRRAFPVFRACGGLLLLQWFWGCSVFVWTRYRINYIYLFDFNPRIVSTALGIFEEAVDNTLIFLVLMLLYYKSGAHDIPQFIPAGGYPFLLVVITLLKLIFPLRSRIPMWNAVWQVVSAPLQSPGFFHGYVGDIFTSLVKVFQDIAWTAGYVVSGDFLVSEDLDISSKHSWSKTFWYRNVLIPVICLLPLIFRFNQCLRRYIDTNDRWPHLANAFKYAFSQTVTLFGAFHPLYLEHTRKVEKGLNVFQLTWLFIFISSSLYSFTWDVYMDWGLGRPKYKYLGPSLMFPKRGYYFMVIALDLVLRFMWVLTLLPPQSGAKFEIPQYLSALTMMLELFRRTIWGFLRLENEHRSNAAGYRRVSVVPLHFNTGHKHHYKEDRHRRGLSVLTEVVVIASAVVGVCVFSVVAAQKANEDLDVKDMFDL